MKTIDLLGGTSWDSTPIDRFIMVGDDSSSSRLISSRDRLRHTTVDKSAVGVPLCQWERDSQAVLIASWRLGCRIGSRTQSTHPPASRRSPDRHPIDKSAWPGRSLDSSGSMTQFDETALQRLNAALGTRSIAPSRQPSARRACQPAR